MTYKMDRKQANYERGDSGVGKIRFSTNGQKVQITLNVPVGKDQFEEKIFKLDRDNCPDNIELARGSKEWQIQMSSDGTKLMSFRPVQGVFVVKTESFASRENEEPAPKHKDVEFVKDGKKQSYSYDYFTVILDILEPEKFAGLTLPLVLRYQFGEFVKDGKSITGFSMGGKYTAQLEEYMIVSGILEDAYQPMEWKDNLLPTMQRIALHEDRKFQVTVKDGWIVAGSLIPYDSPDEEDVPFDEDEVTTTTPTPAFTTTDFDDLEEMEFEPDETEV